MLKSQVKRTSPSAFLGLLTSRLFPLTSKDFGLTLDGSLLVVVLLVVGGLLGNDVTGILRVEVVLGILVVTLNTGACLMVVGVSVVVDVLGGRVEGTLEVVGLGFRGRELLDNLMLSPDTKNIKYQISIKLIHPKRSLKVVSFPTT